MRVYVWAPHLARRTDHEVATLEELWQLISDTRTEAHKDSGNPDVLTQEILAMPLHENETTPERYLVLSWVEYSQ